MKKVILSVLAGLVPIQILWLSGHDLTRSPALACAAMFSFAAALVVFSLISIEESERK